MIEHETGCDEACQVKGLVPMGSKHKHEEAGYLKHGRQNENSGSLDRLRRKIMI